MDEEIIRIVPAQEGNGYVGTASVDVVGTDTSPFKTISLIAKVSENGDSLWTRYLYFWSDSLSSYYHKTEDLAAAPGGGYWLCGQLERNLPGEPLQQGWLLRVDNYGCLSPDCQLVGVGETALENKISLYPNPTADYLVLHHAGHSFQKGQFSIVNLQGQVLRDWVAPMDDLNTVFDLSPFPAGAYILQYREDGVIQVTKQFIVGK